MENNTKRDPDWFRQKVAELGDALQKLPEDRQEVFEAELVEEENEEADPCG